ncbi:MAG TPA: HAD hydrolase-like protein [Gemmataceae bacterium]|nr:HAD hydrolase-like protein [Gemmataceae bacterium]
MPLTLDQYAGYLDTRHLTWPAPPEVDRPRVKPHLMRLPQVRAVTWNVYGTLLAIGGGDLVFQHPNDFVMSVALDKTVQEFKMWASMSRKPGQPSDYMKVIYEQVLDEQRLAAPGEKYPEIAADRLWETIIKKLFQKDYKFDAGFFGSLNEYSRKVAYFFHASLQGTSCYPGAATALRHVAGAGLAQGLLADAQCFTTVQLQRGLAAQEPIDLERAISPELRALSHELRGRKPSERLCRHSLQQLAKRGISPDQVLHVGSRITQDVVPAKRLGMKTALFAGDRASLQATAEQLKEPPTRPDVLLNELTQIADVVSG